VRLLECADSETLPFWAIGAFAGLRRAEIERLALNEIDFEAGVIEVKESKSKTASRRLVTIQPNLCEWLAPYRTHTGPVCPVNLQQKINADRERAGLRTDGRTTGCGTASARTILLGLTTRPSWRLKWATRQQ